MPTLQHEIRVLIYWLTDISPFAHTPHFTMQSPQRTKLCYCKRFGYKLQGSSNSLVCHSRQQANLSAEAKKLWQRGAQLNELKHINISIPVPYSWTVLSFSISFVDKLCLIQIKHRNTQIFARPAMRVENFYLYGKNESKMRNYNFPVKNMGLPQVLFPTGKNWPGYTQYLV